ncbi:exonuclease subunit SbcD [Vogesella fluminis]|uniref:exonuclease subunit SbcD n=1 Tax=Vogesella fluminis TaxID=1069161 RepID=UPI00363CC06F
MRILHTSDWHLGQHFMGKTRQAEHQAFIDWLLRQVREHAVDAVIVAGDLFDTGAPPSYARELYNRLVVDLHGSGTALVLLGATTTRWPRWARAGRCCPAWVPASSRRWRPISNSRCWC